MDRTFDFPSSHNSVPIHAREWSPDSMAPRALLQLSHGMCEHIARYDEFARFLTAEGYVVFGNDHLGHGLTVRDIDVLGHFADLDGWSHVVEDLFTLGNLERQKYPGLPCFMLGHSMGSFVVRTLLIRHPELHFDGVVLTGNSYKPWPVSAFGVFLFSLVRVLFGPKTHPPRLNKMIFGGFNRKFEPARTTCDWLTRDTDIVDTYVEDPLCGFVFTATGYRDLMKGLCEIVKGKNIRKMDPKLPILLAFGEYDTVGNCGAEVKKLAGVLEKEGLHKPDMLMFPGCYHEILNETNRRDVFGDVHDWLDARLK